MSISNTSAGQITYQVFIDFSDAKVELKNFNKEIVDTASDGAAKAGKAGGSKFTEFFKSSFGTAVIAKGVDKVFSAISGSMDNAIRRVDTLNNADKVFSAMGYAVDDVSKSMKTLNGYLDGLPTSMTDAVQGVQLLSAAFGGIDQGTKYFTALNDAGLAFGSTSEQIEGAIRQISQLSLEGPLDAQTWISLQNNGFGPVFAAMAKQAGMTVGELKEDFGSRGTKTVQDFLDTLLKLDNEGTDSMEAFSELARKNTSGIGTAMENVQNRIGKAIAKIIDAIGAENIANAINAISTAIVGLGDVIAGVVNFIQENEVVRDALLAFLITLGLVIMTSVVPAFVAWGAAMLANPLTWIVLGITAIITGLILLVTHIQEVGEFFGSVFGAIGEAIGNVGKFFEEVFGHIGEFVGGVVQNIGDFFNGLFEGIGQGVKAVGDFFVGVWQGVVGVITGIVTTIGNTVAGIFKAIINAVISWFEGFLNGPIDLINAVIGVVDAIVPGDQSGWRIPRIQFGRLATGGIVPATAGGQLILAGEGGEDEWVVPESKMASLIEQLSGRETGGGDTYNIYVDGVFATSEIERRKVADQIVDAIEQNRRARFA